MFGNQIPTSSSIYNAAPEKDRYNDRFDISKKSGVYKQCLGKTSRNECGCTDVLRYSMLEANSDCVERVSMHILTRRFSKFSMKMYIYLIFALLKEVHKNRSQVGTQS